MGIEIDLKRDLKIILLDQFKKGGFLFNKKLRVQDLTRHYFNLRIREIETKPRSVHLSQALRRNPLTAVHSIALRRIERIAKQGESLSAYMTLDLRKPDAFDALLFDWKIHHFHLGTIPEPKDRRFVKRTKNLLFARAEDDAIYLIDILDHDRAEGFANKHLLEVILAEWPHLLNTLGGIVSPGTKNSLTNNEIANVREKGAIALFALSDGKVYFPSGGGQASNGSSVWTARSTDMLMNHIQKVEAEIVSSEEKFRKEIRARDQEIPKTLKFKMLSWNERGVTILEKKSGITFQTS